MGVCVCECVWGCGPPGMVGVSMCVGVFWCVCVCVCVRGCLWVSVGVCVCVYVCWGSLLVPFGLSGEGGLAPLWASLGLPGPLLGPPGALLGPTLGPLGALQKTKNEKN